ncbi:MAG: hypothetical protein SPD91_01185 [Streptococcus hyointestinalis]|uniref:hypothetical protein n=1 Tax=Streptococcus hyointestinalis TaxID=1337 RepID=UPI0023F4DB19|nr:hypothetical protein [Streptococcus hyointestinalis]MCI6871057.1 hypothetical protein [Streptococcus hyointestinalis]MDD6383822.1 hypothetical protein [Streptococcus hyointestinalis]MDD7356006.1 hypothetical protein [Streptococcus hyointestinalis]MDY4553072.1 hypothetical protein [Streptococcus hyointestinalis]
MKNVKITSLSTVFFVLWSVLYILNDMKVLSLSLVNAVPISLVIILYLAIYATSYRMERKGE